MIASQEMTGNMRKYEEIAQEIVGNMRKYEEI
jgi:hypothetical protein